jgi:hypothetical protein
MCTVFTIVAGGLNWLVFLGGPIEELHVLGKVRLRFCNGFDRFFLLTN